MLRRGAGRVPEAGKRPGEAGSEELKADCCGFKTR